MTILYLDAGAGIAGDMTVAALLDLGVPFEYLRQELAKLGLPDDAFAIFMEQVQRGGMTGRHFVVQLKQLHGHHGDHHHRHYSDIRAMIADSSLADRVKQLAQMIFLRLAKAEAQAHQVAIDDVQFHEVGAVDSIVDIVGTAIALDWLGVEKIYTSPVPLGGGYVETAHGRLPVPAPATAELLKGLMIHSCLGEGERVTPTGAAIIAALAEPKRLMPAMTVEKVGHGAGLREFSDCPNILRAIMGTADDCCASDEVLELSCNIDDIAPEVMGYTMERLFQAGALDVWYTSIQMKKNRPGVMLSLVCLPEQKTTLLQLIMAETGTLGVRVQLVQRTVQERRVEERRTRFGPVRFKVSGNGCKPEYEDCCRIAHDQNRPLREIQHLLLTEYGDDH